MPKIKVNDVNLYYEIHGKGSPVVFVAGLAADHTIWQSVVERFAQEHTVVLFDNRGAGQSDCPDHQYTIEMMGDDTAALVEKLQLGSAHFVGNSMGGIIVQSVAYKYPQLTKSVVISNSFHCPNKHERLAAVTKANIELRQAKVFHPAILKMNFASLYSNNFLRENGPVENIVMRVLENPYPTTNTGYMLQSQALLEVDSSQWLNQIKSPCLIITADEDLWADLKQAKYLHNNIVGSKYFCFNDVGHFPHIERTEEFCRLVLDFMAQS